MCAYDDLNTPSAIRENLYFGDVCLLGLGVTGRAVADFFLSNPQCVNSLTIYTGEVQNGSRVFLKALPKSVIVRQDEELVTGSYDLVVASPGIPPHSTLYQSAVEASSEVISEPELAWRVSPNNWIAITGTNGKTTVTELIAALLHTAGKGAWAAGNIGTPCIEVIQNRRPGDWIVAELSSYQLHSTSQLAPDVAVLLNITPDHLSWHGTHQGYAKDKRRILAHLAADKPAVIDVCRPETRAIADELALQGRRVIRVGSDDGLVLSAIGRASDIAYINGSSDMLELNLRSGSLSLLPSNELSIKGPHNLSNALVAAAVVADLGISADDINAGLRNFAPLPNRFEPCGEVAGVSFINDSKATNSDAAIKALSSFTDDAQQGHVIALFGGVDKGTSLAGLVEACMVPCKFTVCYGEAGKRFHNAMASKLASYYEASFDEAFARAFLLAEPGDTILLSPACASFDEFDSFEARGEYFKTAVARLRISLGSVLS